ncbi:helix-turn-helix transcriptional regulator [bacterium]|mgnify:FL=1|jgi:transcriptional regulator with XRE-family HTH domain|nr:helix-turn-helix transcriptional regulator [bacterium]MBT4435427.1 helix-turn-helix transcriptional regulator [bacterium]MDG2446235.1 helix-turn-helix transcriptional regulator [Thermodesulfobacteriota bacterium]
MDSLNVFGSFLKKTRKSKKVTQEQLATSLKVSSVYIHQLETSKVDAPNKSKCSLIAETLNIDPDLVWNKAKEQKLLRFLNKEQIINNLDEPVTYSEKLLIDLYRNLSDEVRKDFIGMIYMLLKSDKRISDEKVLSSIEKLSKTA